MAKRKKKAVTPDLVEQASNLADNTLGRIAHRLNVIWRKWGSEDYPVGNGVQFRNEILLFADWMLYLFTQGVAEDADSPNEWIARNADKFLKMNEEEFARCIGRSLIHMQAFWVYLYFVHNPPMPVGSEARVRDQLVAFGRQLDWIYNVHGVPEDVAKQAYELVVEHIGNEEGYLEESKELLGNFFVRTSLGWSEASSPEFWDQWASSAHMSSRNQLQQDPVQANDFCDRIISECS